MCARTYIPIHNALAEAVCCSEILYFHYDVGRQDVEIYLCIKFCPSQCFPLSVTCTYICVLTKTVFCGFPRNAVFT